MTKDRSRSTRKALMRGLVLLATAAISMSSVAQTRQQPQTKPATSRPPEAVQTLPVLVDATEDYKIGPRDVIEIKVDDAEELSKSYEIGADGTFLLNYLGRVTASGKTSDQLARMIEDGLRDKYLKNPQVSVVVRQFNSHTYVIQGMVNRPGVYQVEARPSVFKLISIAGGLADGHGATAFVFREVRKRPANNNPATAAASSTNGESLDEADYMVTPVKIAGFQRGRLEGNVFLEPGDTVSIPKADVFYVAGEVNAPGSFPLSDGMTLRQALALSQGTTSNAKSDETAIMRTDTSTGKLQEIKIDLNAVLKNKAEDVTLQANDLIIVPNSRGKTVMNNLLKAFGLGAAQRGVYRY